MVHRLGRLLIGETSVAVIVTAPHRKAGLRSRAGRHQPAQAPGPHLEERAFRRRRGLGGRRVGPRCSARSRRLAPLPALAALLGAQGVIRVNVRLVHVLATVKNPAGELVGALNKDDFEILDNGVRQQIAVFERQTEQPLSVAMMVDASGSTAKDLKYEVDSVARFFKALFAEGNPRTRWRFTASITR